MRSIERQIEEERIVALGCIANELYGMIAYFLSKILALLKFVRLPVLEEFNIAEASAALVLIGFSTYLYYLLFCLRFFIFMGSIFSI